MGWCKSGNEHRIALEWPDIKSANDMLQLNLTPEESAFLFQLSNVFVNSMHKYREKDVKDPYEYNNQD